jgi:hypothetical protein
MYNHVTTDKVQQELNQQSVETNKQRTLNDSADKILP